MNAISWRHHYIPQFYLKGFTSKNGKFRIYDVIKKQFIKNGKEFSPQSYFFEKNGNTWTSLSDSDDSTEKAYGKIDNRIAKIFLKINQSTYNERFNVNDDDIAQIQHFVGIMYWRIPANYNEIKNIIDRKKLKELGLLIQGKNKKKLIYPLSRKGLKMMRIFSR